MEQNKNIEIEVEQSENVDETCGRYITIWIWKRPGSNLISSASFWVKDNKLKSWNKNVKMTQKRC